jgi:hypothetical protein
MIVDVIKANDKNDHDAADIICADCKSIIATLHAPSAHWAAGRCSCAAAGCTAQHRGQRQS